MGPEEWIVVIVVVGARLLLPFTIPYWPLPGAIACMILDSIDQSIFQQFPAIPLEGYQSYDKSLDIYYLAIMYMATMRNWVNPMAFKMSFFLYYYRLIGVVAFELSQVRAILFIFPNTFEYFWDFVEAVRMRWNTMRMGMWTVILSAAAIWVFIKLPQEYWIHIAQRDMTDAIKELFGVDPTDSWGAAISNRPGLLVAAIVAVAVLLLVIYWIVTRKAPAGDHGIRLKADPLPPECQGSELYRTAKAAEGLFDRALLEKVVLTGLITVIFAQYMLSDDVRSVGVLAFVAAFVAVNALVSQWLARRGREWKSVGIELAGMFVVNYAIIVGLQLAQRVLGLIDTRTPLGLSLFFVFLFTVITVLFDRYRTVLTARGVLAKRADEAA
ncbi:MAG TPA: hypothetical protein VLA35_06330 [Thermoleophilia bacterium]|nr:hypothetical protein [Thermoleophilia bacterium]